MGKKVTLLDGAGGTSLWEKAEEKGVKKGPVWKYNIEHPEFVTAIVKEYAQAGSQVIYTNTFGANRTAVKRFSDYSVKEVVGAGVKLTKEALEGTSCKTALSIGPLSALLEPYGNLSVEEAEDIFREQIGAGAVEHPDYICLETFMDVEMMKIAVKVAKEYNIPIWCSMTFEKTGRTMMGNSVEDLIQAVEPLGVAAVGMNCSLGPEQALPIICEFAEKTSLPILFKPNAGMPIYSSSGEIEKEYTPEMFIEEVLPSLPYVDYVGGCCGTNPDYIKSLGERLREESYLIGED